MIEIERPTPSTVTQPRDKSAQIFSLPYISSTPRPEEIDLFSSHLFICHASSSSFAHLSFQPSRRLKIGSSEKQQAIKSMKPQQEPKKAANGLAARQEMAVRYRECRRNFAASLGGYMVDGCREFKPARPQGMADSFRCATCGCHRSFHKREVEPEPAYDYFSDSTCTE